MRSHPLCAFVIAVFLTPCRAEGPEERFFDSKGVRIRYLIQGKGEPVVLIHGFGAPSAEFMWIKNPFAEPNLFAHYANHFRLIAPECRGHGKSDKPLDPKQYGREMAEDVVRLLDHLEIKKAHVAGYSMGAMIAGKLLTTHPDRLLSVTLGGAMPVCEPDQDFLSVMEALGKSLDEGKGIGPLIMALSPTDQPRPTLVQVAVASKLFIGDQDQKVLAAVTKGVLGLEVKKEELKANKVPVFVVYGSRDEAVKKRIEPIRPVLANATYKVIEGGDHVETALRPEFRKAVDDFIKAHAARP